MVAHILPRHAHRRQDVDSFAAPTVDGLVGAGLTVEDSAATGTGLAIHPTATGNRQDDVDSLGNPFVVSTQFIQPTASRSLSVPSQTASPKAATSDDISMGTVIGACIGAFAGAAFLVLLGIWIYKRGSPKPRPRDPVSAGNRNADGEEARSRSRLENWNRLDDKDEDSWEGKHQMKEADTLTIAPMEKLTMFKKSTPSVRSMYTHKSEIPAFDLGPHPFSPYHTGLAQELASADVSQPVVRQGSSPPILDIPWDRGSANDSFLTLRSNHMSGSITNSTDMAIPTPPATYTELHRWHSAEVVDFTGQKAEVVDPSENPFEHPMERRKSNGNPFFGASITRKSSYIPPPPPAITRGAPISESEHSKNPFSDNYASGHLSTQSTDSSNDRAIQSLIAALNITNQEAEERLRVASMQTTDSVYSDVASSFPLPPR